MKMYPGIALLAWLAVFPLAEADDQAVKIFDAPDYPGAWTLATNPDLTITAAEAAVHREGAEVYSRVLRLETVAREISRTNPPPAAATDIRQFIRGYRPPAIPYTSEAAADRTGSEKFNCLEFAEDLVKQAAMDDIPAQVVGVLFEGMATGHAVAGFPTAEGGMLYFDSTPGPGRISHSAHEAQVQVGKPYQREGGGELAGVGKLPVSEIISVTGLMESAGSLIAGPEAGSVKTVLVVADETRVQAKGIDYAGPDTLEISDGQLAKWDEASNAIQAALTFQQDRQNAARQNILAQAAARALAEDERLAAGNDAYGQLRMGERYLTGDGVATNLTMAESFLQQAAAQGSPTAVQELKTLNEQTDGKNSD
jgi:TPR repeat protein